MCVEESEIDQRPQWGVEKNEYSAIYDLRVGDTRQETRNRVQYKNSNPLKNLASKAFRVIHSRKSQSNQSQDSETDRPFIVVCRPQLRCYSSTARRFIVVMSGGWVFFAALVGDFPEDGEVVEGVGGDGSPEAAGERDGGGHDAADGEGEDEVE